MYPTGGKGGRTGETTSARATAASGALSDATAQAGSQELELTPYDEPSVSVVVTARNAAHQLPRLFAALERQTLPAGCCELIVVDDASEDNTAEVVRASPKARLISVPEHVGLPTGRNLGIRASRAPIVTLTDADCVPDETWLELGLQRMEASEADLLAGGITIPVGTDPAIASLVDSATYLDQERYTTRGFGAGANLWVRRDVFERFGYFNEDLESYGGDEEEFCQRATTQGARIVYAPEVHVIHPPRVRMRDLARKAYRLGTASRLTGASTRGLSVSIRGCSSGRGCSSRTVASTAWSGCGACTSRARPSSSACTSSSTSACSCR
jgi:GT2 family glycosyltransferase